MSKHASKEAYFQRLQQLAEVKKPSIKESRNLGTLIDYKRAADGIAYGIVKEQHHYYIKKAGTKENPDASDFAYIGGLANITEYQYKKLSEADKHRSMILHTINEGYGVKVSKTGSKKKLNEDKAGEEIEMADQKASELDAATAAETEPEVPATDDGGDAEMAAGLEAEPAVDAEVPAPDAETPAPEGGEDTEIPALDGAEGGEDTEIPALDGVEGGEEGGEDTEIPALDGAEGGEEGSGETIPADSGEEKTDEIKEFIGKAGEKVMKSDLSKEAIEGYIKEFLGYFKEKLSTELDPKERKDLADETIIAVETTKDDAEKDLETSMPSEPVATDGEEVEEEVCAECGGFGKYAESRGYSSKSIQECGEEELGNVVSGYANAYNDGQNDGDFKMVALLVTPEMLSKLKDEYGHDDYADKLAPEVNSLAECKLEEKQMKIAELWNGNTDTNNVTTQPDMLKEEEEEEETPEHEEGETPEEEKAEHEFGGEEVDDVIDGAGIGFAPAAQNLGGGVVKPEGAGVEIKVTPDKTVNISMNESEKKLRKYIRERLEVKAGIRKETLNESKKSETLKKLDKVIDQQFKLYESVVAKKVSKK